MKEFPQKWVPRTSLDQLTLKIYACGTTDRRPGSGHPKFIRATDNMDVVMQELISSQDDKVFYVTSVSLLGTTGLMFIEPDVKINVAYYRDVLLCQHLLPEIRSVAGDFFTMLQHTELVTSWSFCLAVHQISSHRCCGRPIALT